YLCARYGSDRDLHSLPHDALPISMTFGGGAGPKFRYRTTKPGTTTQSLPSAPRVCGVRIPVAHQSCFGRAGACALFAKPSICRRSEEHTSELQSRFALVCRLLLDN